MVCTLLQNLIILFHHRPKISIAVSVRCVRRVTWRTTCFSYCSVLVPEMLAIAVEADMQSTTSEEGIGTCAEGSYSMSSSASSTPSEAHLLGVSCGAECRPAHPAAFDDTASSEFPCSAHAHALLPASSESSARSAHWLAMTEKMKSVDGLV